MTDCNTINSGGGGGGGGGSVQSGSEELAAVMAFLLHRMYAIALCQCLSTHTRVVC